MIPTRISFEQLNELLLGFYHSGAYESPVSAKDAAIRTSVSSDVASRQTKFLTTARILVREGEGYRLTTQGLQYTQFLDYNQIEGASRVLADILKDYEVTKKIIQFVRITGPLPKIDVILRVGLVTGSKNSSENRRGFVCFIDMLLFAKLVEEDSDQMIRIHDEKSISLEVLPSQELPKRKLESYPLGLEIVLKVDNQTNLQSLRKIIQVVREVWMPDKQDLMNKNGSGE